METTYLTKSELAALLRVTTRTVENYVRTGTLPKPLHVGRKSLWPRVRTLAHIERMVAGRKR